MYRKLLKKTKVITPSTSPSPNIMNQIQESMWHVMELLKEFNTLLSFYEDQEVSITKHGLQDRLEELIKNKEGPKLMTISYDDFSKVVNFVEYIYNFFQQQALILERYYNEIKGDRYHAENDPIMQKIKSMSKQIVMLEATNRDSERRIKELAKQQSDNIVLIGRLKEVEKKLRSQEEIQAMLLERANERDIRIQELELQLQEKIRKAENSEAERDRYSDTLHKFGVFGILGEYSDPNSIGSRFEIVLNKSQIFIRLLSFMTPTDMNELSFTSKINYSLLRNAPNLLNLSFNNVIYDRKVVDRTVVQGKPYLANNFRTG